MRPGFGSKVCIKEMGKPDRRGELVGFASTTDGRMAIIMLGDFRMEGPETIRLPYYDDKWRLAADGVWCYSLPVK